MVYRQGKQQRWENKQNKLQLDSVSCNCAQGAYTASELALQLRKLDGAIQWEAFKRPPMDSDNPFACAEVLQRRPGAAPATGGWDYLVQMAPVETAPALSLGPGSGFHGLRQPLQPLTAVPGAQQAQQQQQQPMSKQTLLGQPLMQLPQQLQEAERQQQQQMPDQALSLLPNHVAVQQRQQAYGAEEDKQIAVQQAVSALSDAELPRQLPVIAESASRRAVSAAPDQLQTDKPGSHGVSAAGASEGVDAGKAVSPPLVVSKSLDLGSAPVEVQTAEERDSLPSAELPSEATNGGLPLDSRQRTSPDAKLSQHSDAQLNSEAVAAPQQPSPPPSLAAHPTPAPTPFLTQQLPNQASSLLSLIPSNQHRRSLAATSASTLAPPLGPPVGTQGYSSGAGPSREGTPAPRGHPTWLHESQLPLWLVKTFEEKRRRDVSMVAARAAQQAQRNANAASKGLLNMSYPWRHECECLSEQTCCLSACHCHSIVCISRLLLLSSLSCC